MNPTTDRLLISASRHSHLAAPIAAVVILLVLLVPLPPLLLDVLISMNLMISIVVLLVSVYILQPVKFTSFPSLLLLTTLYRLALNVATSRLILSHGETGTSAAGQVIKAFGEFVIGGNYVVGIVIFLILLAIQFLVVNHGAVRSSEVTARFTLDAMPGKQMAVDADLSAGIIDEHEAKRRRHDIGQAAEFHGSMDGAIRFTQRDAVASILITAVNIIAGFAIGVLQHGMALSDALQTYTILTVGDGVAAAVPSLFVSVAAALITVRSASEENMGEEMSSQLLINPRPLLIAAAVLGALGLLPGMPHAAFLLLSALAAGGGYLSQQAQNKTVAHAAAQVVSAQAALPPEPEKIEKLLKLDALALEVGYGLIPLVSAGDTFLGRVREIRRQIAVNLGIIVPPVHITDNLQLNPREYAILLKGERVARGELYPDNLLAIDPGAVREQIEGIATTDPAFGMPAVWLREAEVRDRALAAGYTVVDPTTVVCTHLSEVIKRYAPDLLGRQETRALLDTLSETHPKTVEEATPKVLSLGEVQRVLQNLLRETVPIRDLATILEAITDAGSLTRDVNALTEAARAALARTICSGLSSENGELTVLTLAPQLERQFAERFGLNGSTQTQALEPEFGRLLLEKIESAIQAAVLSQPVILCSAAVRPHLRKLTVRFLPDLAVIAHGEVAPNVRLVSIGTVG
ncbi:MAG: flagellar biosynthesis protein FlhA [Acidobacteria bacterium]|nr:flagellar biosynthesis protein FlhA [Acidobacteriota bacterium]MBI3428240.1 flagellar biosynthesis protein FlhA [Acidobacteriota bacterium]